MKFQCNCGHILFDIDHQFSGYETTDQMSMFTDDLRWQSDPLDQEYVSTCLKCGKGWRADNMDGLKEAMQKDGVLK